MTRIRFLLTLTFLIGFPLLALVHAQEIRVGLSGEPSNLDPAINAGTPARTVRLLVYRGLFNYNGENGEVTPELAESYEVSDDGLTYTIKIRDAQFHNGDPVTADDVKFSLERLLDPETGATFRDQLAVIDQIEVVDDKTVQIHLTESAAPFLHYLALPESAIVSKAYVEETGGSWDTSPVGAGPYIFKEYLDGQRIVLEKNPNFYKPGLPITESIVFEFYADSSLRLNALRSGDVDLIEYVAWRDVPTIQADDDLKLLGGVGPFMGLVFNTEFEPFSDPRVRQAVAYAIDRQVIINTAFSGQGEPIYGMAVPENSLAYAPEFADYFNYNVERAQELLNEAGYPDGFSARLLATSEYDFHMNTAVAVQSELSKTGIQVELDLPDWATRLEQNLRGDYDLLVIGTAGDISDPDFLADFYLGGSIRLNNAPGYDNEQLNELLREGRRTLDPDARQEIYRQIQEIALEDSPLVYLMWRDQSYASTQDLKGFTPLPGFLSFQSGIMLERAYEE